MADEQNIGKIEPRPISSEMQESYLDYAMSVIIARALPDVRDGLKPVHRRILYAMWSMGLRPGAKFRKSATVVGEVLGKFHPHGDTAVYDSLVRMAQDFSLRYPLIAGQGNFGCFTKDTRVKLADGRNASFEELIAEDLQGKRNYTYTVNALGNIAMAEIRHPRLTIQDAELVRVSLDNGEQIRCTPNHKFMLRGGEYCEAQDLKRGDSLMPLYERLSEKTDRLSREGYVLVRQNKTGEWVPAHHLADNFNLTLGAYKKSDGRVRHHVDFNKLNNSPENVRRVHWGEHWKIHYTHAANQHQNLEYREKIAEGRRKFWADPKNRVKQAERMSERNRENWQNEEYREKKSEQLSDTTKKYIATHPEVREIMSARMTRTLKRLWQDSAYRASMHEKILKGNRNHATNSTGKRKFLAICRATLEEHGTLNAQNYNHCRSVVYPYGAAPLWDTGLEKYFQSNSELALLELNGNHKVVGVERLSEREDVYDLTIDGTHNFCLAAGVFVHNSMDGDAAAAMRYTESKLAAPAEDLLSDIEKETVDFVPNYDGSHKEPQVLPARLPNLLLNGTMGIAVGMATNIPPHNLTELCDAIAHLAENPDATMEDLMQFVHGPDFPTGGIIFDKKAIAQAYATGKGGIVMRAKAEIVEGKSGDHRIIISEVPFQVNKATLLQKIAELVREKKLEGIRDLRDESAREGVRIVIELKKDAYPKKVLNRLYQATQLQETFHVNMLALVDGIQPRVLTLKGMLEEYLKHRNTVVRRRTAYDLARAKERAHILEGLAIAIANIDAVIATIKKSADRDEARVNLIKKFKLSELQAVAILEMRLQQLANLERLKVETELKEKRALIKELEAILVSPKRILGVVKNEIEELKKRFGDERRTQVVSHGVKEFATEDLIPNEPTIVMVTRDGYIKRMPPETFRTQSRGGKGVIGLTTREEDVVEQLFSTTTHADLLFFTTRGRVFQLKAYDVPAASRTAKGQALVNFLQLGANEKVSAVLAAPDLREEKYLVMVTRNGIIKKTDISDFESVRRSGLIALRLRDDDTLEWVKPSTGKDEIILVTAQGQSIRFRESDVRPMGRVASGVHGMRMQKGDQVVGMDVIAPSVAQKNGLELLVVMEMGFGKRTPIRQYKVQGRGGSGVLTAKITEKTGEIVSAMVVNAKDERDLLVVSAKGQVIRVPAKTVSVLGRATQGVRIMRFKEPNDRVASVTLI